MLSILGATQDDIEEILKGLGYRADAVPAEEASQGRRIRHLLHEPRRAIYQTGFHPGEITPMTPRRRPTPRPPPRRPGWGEVLTGVALVSKRGAVVEVARTRVWVNPLHESEIADYVSTGEPLDKAGAYGIQGLGSKFIDRIQGNYSNVVGLPVSLVYRLLKGYPER